MQDKVAQVHTAVKEGRLEDLKELLDSKLLAAAADHTGLPPLHKAVIYQQGDLVQSLITEFPDTLNIKDYVSESHSHIMTYMIRIILCFHQGAYIRVFCFVF